MLLLLLHLLSLKVNFIEYLLGLVDDCILPNWVTLWLEECYVSLSEKSAFGILAFSTARTPIINGVVKYWPRNKDSTEIIKKKLCQMIDFVVSYDTSVNSKETEKIEKYQDLARELL